MTTNLSHLFHLFTSSASVTTEALACTTRVVADTATRTVLSRYVAVATVHLAAICVKPVPVIEVTLAHVFLLFAWQGFALSLRVGLLPTGAAKGCVVLQLVVGNYGGVTAFVIKGVRCRRALNQGATWTTVAFVTQATPVHVTVPCAVIRGVVVLPELLSPVSRVMKDLFGFSNCPVVSKVPVRTASSVARAVIGAASTLAR